MPTLNPACWSSRLGGVASFPPDILLGTIKTFAPGPLYGEALVEPAVDFTTLQTVFVKIPKTSNLPPVRLEQQPPTRPKSE